MVLLAASAVACASSVGGSSGAPAEAAGVSGNEAGRASDGTAGIGGTRNAAAGAAGTPSTSAVAGSVGNSAGAPNGGASGESAMGGSPTASGGNANAGAVNGGTTSGGDSAAGAATGGSSNADFVPCPPHGTACKIMPLGDSITFGYGSTTGGGYRVGLLSRALADGKSLTFVGSQASGPDELNGAAFPKQNEGHSGYSIDDSSKTKGISPLVDAALAQYQPHVVLLMIGTNDMHYTLDLANAPARLGALLDRITQDSPDALVVVAQIVPANGAQNAPTQTYNAAIPALVNVRAKAGKHLVLVNQYAALGSWSTAEFKDSEHPNDAGYLKMADTWYAALREFLH